MIQGAPDVPGVHACCKDPRRLVRIEDRPPFTTDQCLVCGRKHRRLTIDLTAILKDVP